MSDPVVSIVMRTKDRVILLQRAIADVTRQNFRDWELIIVNDGGDPAPVDHLLALFDRELAGRAHVIHNPTSTGMEHASNQAIERSVGKFICVHDDDDTWDPRFLEETVSYLRDHPDAGGVATRIEIVLEKIEGSQVREIGRQPAWQDIHQFSLTELMSQNIAVPIGCLYRASAISDLGGFRDDLPVVGDWEFHLRLAVAYDVGFIDGEPLAFWHQRRSQGGVLGNSVFAGSDDHAYFDLKVRDEYLREYAKKNGVGSLLFFASLSHKYGSQKTAFNFMRRKARELIHFLRAYGQKRSASSTHTIPSRHTSVHDRSTR